MAETKIAVLWGVLIAMMVACAGIYATLKAREMNPYIGGTSTRIESVQPQGEASARPRCAPPQGGVQPYCRRQIPDVRADSLSPG